MYENIFNRVEQKYVLTKSEKDNLLKLINKYIKKDEYFDSVISNIYFDDFNNRLIINSMEKPIYKDKVRLRGYGDINKNSNVFFEIKNKYRGVVGKRRIMMRLDDFYKYLDGEKIFSEQIMKELDYLIKIYNLEPKIFISYHRNSYKGINDDIRITFDNDLISRRYDLKLDNGIYGDKYFNDDKYIMEIKTLNGYPMWLVDALSSLKIFPNSFSKYGSIYKKERSLVYA